MDNIKMYLRETEERAMDWIDLAEVRDQWRALIKIVMDLRVPYIFGKFLRSSTT
jgi:hypothetical protein